MTSDTRYRNRAMLEARAVEHGAKVEHRRDGAGWTVTVEGRGRPETIVVVGGPADTIESSCVIVLEGLVEAGQAIAGSHPPQAT